MFILFIQLGWVGKEGGDGAVFYLENASLLGHYPTHHAFV
jgi:hypothetical protein